MEEKEIVSGKPASKKILIFILLVVIIAFLLPFGYDIWKNISAHYSHVHYRQFLGNDLYRFMHPIALVIFIVYWIFYYAVSEMEVVVTSKRVYGTALFRKRVDLPLDSISAVSTSAFKGIAVASPSGIIKFKFVENYQEIHNEISALLIKRQDNESKSSKTIITQKIPQSNADELKKYKELLDSGAITQEEFDAKKKQLLGV